jgi:hypothetical protein
VAIGSHIAALAFITWPYERNRFQELRDGILAIPFKIADIVTLQILAKFADFLEALPITNLLIPSLHTLWP